LEFVPWRFRMPTTIIAEGAAIVARNNWMPYLSRDLRVILSDGTPYMVLERGQVLKPEVCSKELQFYCTDPRDGAAKLVIAEQSRLGDSGAISVKEILAVPVSRHRGSARSLERVTARFDVTEDLVLRVQAWGATVGSVSRMEIHNLCFGIRTR